jgi:uncharacterized membrane protein
MDFTAFISWILKFLAAAYISSDSSLSIFSWLFSLVGLVVFFISLWGLPEMKRLSKEQSDKILKYAKPLSIVAN